jgi:hypothetical protein
MSIKIASLALASGLLLATQPALASRPLALAIGQQVRGEITSASPINVNDGSRSQQYQLELDAGQAVRFEVSGALDATVSLLRDGELIARSGERGDGKVLTVRAPGKGRYLLAVNGKDARSFGPFALSSAPIQAYAGGPVPIGQTISDVADRARELQLQVDEAGLYEIRMASTDFDTVLSLHGDGVDASNDDANGSDSMITHYLQPGQYQLRADGFMEKMGGQYTLEVRRRALPEGVALAADGELEPGTQLRALYVGQPVSYRISVPGGQMLRVDMASNDFDSLLQLNGEGGLELTDDDSGDRLNARLMSMLPAGQYRIQPKAADQGTGVFTLKAELMDAPADAGGGRLQPGQTRSARLYGGADSYQVQIERAGSYVIDMQSDDIDSSLELLHNGASLAEDDDGGDGLNARIVELLQPGTYTIRARALYNYGGSEGSYRISINRR